MSLFSYTIWTFAPELFTIPGITYAPRWYGVLFASGFIIGQQIFYWIFKEEERPKLHVDKLTTYMVVASIVGARLGHCLFYDPMSYLSQPWRILMVWEGGLASHGGAIGILVALYMFARKYNYSWLWVVDRIVIVVALGGAMIRTGNLANSEMEGTMTGSSTGIVYARGTYDVLNYDDESIENIRFEKGGELVSDQPDVVPITIFIEYKDGAIPQKAFIEGRLSSTLARHPEVVQHVSFGDGPLQYKSYKEKGREVIEIAALGNVRHAAQLYEAAYCIMLMFFLLYFWKYKRWKLPEGFNFAFFMIVLWSARFVDEYFKMNQVDFEEGLAINMGQILSIPMALAGVGLMIWAFRRDKKMSEF